MSKIKIQGMQFYAFHGCFVEEQVVGTHFQVNCTITTDCKLAASTDDLTKTINYQEVYVLIKQTMQQTSHLLENVAYRIIKVLQNAFPMITEIEVEVQKMNPPLGGKIENVAVILNSNELK